MWLKEGWVWDRHRTRASGKMMRTARRSGVALEENGNRVLEMSPVKKAVNGLTTWDLTLADRMNMELVCRRVRWTLL